MKASIIERFIKTIKKWLWKRFTYNCSHKRIGNELTDVINTYNHKIHLAIEDVPVTVNPTSAHALTQCLRVQAYQSST